MQSSRKRIILLFLKVGKENISLEGSYNQWSQSSGFGKRIFLIKKNYCVRHLGISLSLFFFCSEMNLPFEILHEIFIKLHQSDKLECMLVCRHWNIAMEQGTLYDTVYLYSKNGFDALVTTLSNSPSMASKVNRLLILLGFGIELNIKPLLLLLPNVQTLYSMDYEIEDISFDQDTVFPFFDHIQDSDNTIVHNILQAHSCLNLTTLRVCDFQHDFVPLLKNTPNLISLRLGAHITGFNSPDTIHKSVPRLQSLQLLNIYMENINLKHVDLTPAQTLVECVFGNVITNNSSTLLNLLKYIAMKYIKLSKFEFWLYSTMRLSDDANANLNENGWAPLFQTLGRQLKKISLGGLSSEQQTTLLDDSDCRIKHLTIDCGLFTMLSRLAESNQILYVHTLALKAINTGSLVWLNQFRVLSKLKIGSGTDIFQSDIQAVNFPDIITHAPSTLKTLFISQPIQPIDPYYKGVSHSIKKVSFCDIKFPYCIDTFLSKCIPNLSSLKVKHCRRVERIFNLAKLSLFSFRFIENYHNNVLDNKIIIVLTTGDNERRLYKIGNQIDPSSIDKHLRPFYMTYKSWPAQDVDNDPGFTLICHSLKNIAFH
jgi:hypothetical protein